MEAAEFDQMHQMFFRMIIATILGASLGVDRDYHRKPAGVRVLALVGLGAAAITMVSVIVVAGSNLHPSAGVLPAVQGVLSGIGFLGAGVIMRAQGKDEVHGITTAASIWLAAILGMICGLGQWRMAVCATVVAFIVLVVGRLIELQILKFAPPPTPSPLDAVTHPDPRDKDPH